MKKILLVVISMLFIACTGPSTSTMYYGLDVDNPVAELPFDIEINDITPDISGEGNSASLEDGASLVYGRAGHGLHTSGSNDQHALISEATELDLDEEYTISFWFKTTEDRFDWDGTKQREMIFIKGSNFMIGFEQEYSLDEHPTGDICLRNYVRYTDLSNQSSEIHDDDCSMRDGKWHYAVFSFKKGGDMKIYIDGATSGDCNDTEATRRNLAIKMSTVQPHDYVIGARIKSDGTVDRELDFIIDHLQIHPKQLSDSEVQLLYNGSTP